jgi:signal transduction histidine kinase
MDSREFKLLTRARRSTKPSTPEPAATLVSHLQRKLEAERARVARRLHGDVAGMLAAARMDLSRLASNLADDDRDVREQVVRVDQILEQVIQNARSEMQRLHPALLDHFGLGAALRHTVEERCRAVGAEYTLDVPEFTDGVAAPASLATYRVIESMLATRSLRRVGLRLRESTTGYQLLAEVERGETADPAYRDDLRALRAWLESMGATWSEARRGDVESVELTVPHGSLAAVATPGS